MEAGSSPWPTPPTPIGAQEPPSTPARSRSPATAAWAALQRELRRSQHQCRHSGSTGNNRQHYPLSHHLQPHLYPGKLGQRHRGRWGAKTLTITQSIRRGRTINKTGLGTLVLPANDTYGDTIAEQGTLQTSATSSLGAGAVTMSGGTLELKASGDSLVATNLLQQRRGESGQLDHQRQERAGRHGGAGHHIHYPSTSPPAAPRRWDCRWAPSSWPATPPSARPAASR